MKRKLDFTLPTRSSTIGHWHFNAALDDNSDQANHLTGEVEAADFIPGPAEDGQTALLVANKAASIPAAESTDFAMGSNSFSVEILFRADTSTNGVLINKHSSWAGHDGWYLDMNAAVSCVLGDGTNYALAATAACNDQAWHYVVATVDRVNDELKIYLDGVQQGSTVSIASLTGDINGSAYNLIVGGNVVGGAIDEICVSTEVLSAAAVADRAAGRFVPVPDNSPDLFLTFLPGINNDNEKLRQFLIPSATAYNESRSDTDDLRHLMEWDRCPVELLPHLASMLGFELIDLPFATETERRLLLYWAVWIYKRKGTLAGVQKLIELLGYTVVLTEVFSDDYPFITNYSRTWDRDNLVSSQFYDTFNGNLSLWSAPLSIDSWWRKASSSVLGTGNGSDDNLNAILCQDNKSKYFMYTTYTVILGHGVNTEFGVYLSYESSFDWVRIELATDAAGDDLLRIRQPSGVVTLAVLNDIINYAVGTHSLWAYCNHADGRFTIGIDNTTLAFNIEFVLADTTTSQKGLWVNRSLTVAFGDVRFQELDRSLAAKIWDPAFADKTLQITLSGTPEYAASKLNYLKQIIPQYVPTGVDLEWL